MADSDNISIARRLYEDWNNRDFDHLAGLLATDGEIMLVGSGTSFPGPEGARQFAQMWATAFPDGQVAIERAAASGDQVTIEHTGRAHTPARCSRRAATSQQPGSRSRSSSVTSSRSRAARSSRCAATSTRCRC